MARIMKVTLKKRQSLGLASKEDSIRRRNEIKKRKSAYGERLEQKQKLKIIYGIMEHQMTRYVREAFNSQEDPQLELMRKLESRLDNVVYRLGFAKTREQARQMVNHGHILVDGHKVDIPSYSLKQGQTISLKSKMAAKQSFLESIKKNRQDISQVSYLEYSDTSGRVLNTPQPTDFVQNVELPKVLEFYRKMV